MNYSNRKEKGMNGMRKKLLRLLVFIIAAYLVLMIPYPEKELLPKNAPSAPFSWNRDSLWNNLESAYREARDIPETILDEHIDSVKRRLDSLMIPLLIAGLSPTDPVLLDIRDQYFNLAPLIAANPSRYGWYATVFYEIRRRLKAHSLYWKTSDQQTREVLYTVLYGMRAALEEVQLQIPASMAITKENHSTVYIESDSMKRNNDVIFHNPATSGMDIDYYNPVYAETEPIIWNNIELHSGDIFLSRGGADVSAFISRGNDFPGNFSHVALLRIDPETKVPMMIEAHIERGVAIASLDEYMQDKKLRILLLRANPNLPMMQHNRKMPQQAAELMYNEYTKRHIPYDFAMDHNDSTTMFCSEVVSFAYRKNGLTLWRNMSTISSPGMIQWLHDFGVKNFLTQMPSDLEYDPSLSIVAEWKNADILFRDHIDNAVMDYLYEQANQGKRIGYNSWKLPLARLLKAYCSILNIFGKEGIIPEGMTATQALKNERFSAMFDSVRQQVLARADAFQKQNGYRPPYWRLLEMARGD